MAGSFNFLLLVLVGVGVSTLTIVLVFIIINLCISKHLARRRTQKSRQMDVKTSQEKISPFPEYTDVEKPPPLPSREQFLNTDSRSNSYEDINTSLDPINFNVQTSAPPEPRFLQHSEINTHCEDSNSVGESYDDIEDLNHNGSQSYQDVESLPDYLELEDDQPTLQLQPETFNYQSNSRESLASYDDIGTIDNISEDYDDVQ